MSVKEMSMCFPVSKRSCDDYSFYLLCHHRVREPEKNCFK